MKNQLKTIALMGGLSALLISLGGMMGEGMLYGALILALLMNFVTYFYSDRIVLRMQGAQEADPAAWGWLHQMVAELADRAGIPKPRVYIVPELQPNAFATGRNPDNGAVAVTQGIVQLLDRRELRGVLAHELAHIKNRDILVATIAAAVASAVTYLANIAQWATLFGAGRSDDEEGSPAAALVMALVAPIAATLIQLGISRSREYLADASGAEICGDPEALARALEKLHLGASRIPADVSPATASLFIVSPLAGGRSLSKLFSTHPPMEERVARLRDLGSRAGRPVRWAAG